MVGLFRGRRKMEEPIPPPAHDDDEDAQYEARQALVDNAIQGIRSLAREIQESTARHQSEVRRGQQWST